VEEILVRKERSKLGTPNTKVFQTRRETFSQLIAQNTHSALTRQQQQQLSQQIKRNFVSLPYAKKDSWSYSSRTEIQQTLNKIKLKWRQS